MWLKNEDVPGLAMTRSFGDEVASRVGVIAEPGKFLKILSHFRNSRVRPEQRRQIYCAC